MEIFMPILEHVARLMKTQLDLAKEKKINVKVRYKTRPSEKQPVDANST